MVCLHQTCIIASDADFQFIDADFQFIMCAVLGQKQDSPLFKAYEKARTTDVEGITSLTDRAIDRLGPARFQLASCSVHFKN